MTVIPRLYGMIWLFRLPARPMFGYIIKVGESDRRIIGRKKEKKVNPTPISRQWKGEEKLEEAERRLEEEG